MAQVVVEGTVEKVKAGGKGIVVRESWSHQGQDRHRDWQTWFASEHSLAAGQRVKVSGRYSDKVASFSKPDGETVTYTERSLNDTTVLEVVDSEPFIPTGEPDEDPGVPF